MSSYISPAVAIIIFAASLVFLVIVILRGLEQNDKAMEGSIEAMNARISIFGRRASHADQRSTEAVRKVLIIERELASVRQVVAKRPTSLFGMEVKIDPTMKPDEFTIVPPQLSHQPNYNQQLKRHADEQKEMADRVNAAVKEEINKDSDIKRQSELMRSFSLGAKVKELNFDKAPLEFRSPNNPAKTQIIPLKPNDKMKNWQDEPKDLA